MMLCRFDLTVRHSAWHGRVTCCGTPRKAWSTSALNWALASCRRQAGAPAGGVVVRIVIRVTIPRLCRGMVTALVHAA